ncbi:MAG: hypothetical protein R2857_06760 [Vampirovibrionales bacterium]
MDLPARRLPTASLRATLPGVCPDVLPALGPATVRADADARLRCTATRLLRPLRTRLQSLWTAASCGPTAGYYDPYGQQQGYGGGFAPPYAQPVAYPSPYPQGMVPYGFMPWGPQPVMLVELANFYNPMFGQGYGGGGSQPINYMDLLALQGGNSQLSSSK